MKNLLLAMLVISTLTSCSVVMAAKKDGTSIERVQGARTRAQILATGPVVISSEYNQCNDLVETYQFQKPRGSAARAFMHGVLDISTCGIWEVIGTPIEACQIEKEFYIIRITYDQNDVVKLVELL